MSNNYERESRSPPSPHAFSGEDLESVEALVTDGGSTKSEGLVEGLIVENSKVGKEEQSVSSWEGGRSLSRNVEKLYIFRGCYQSGLGYNTGFGSQFKWAGVPVEVLLSKRNKLTLYELEQLKVDFQIPDCVGLRLLTLTEAVRSPPERCVMVFSAIYKNGLRLPLHPWVQMMLARLGYALGQYNPNFWIILQGVQQGNFGWVKVNCRKANERGYFIGGHHLHRSCGGTDGSLPLKIGSVGRGQQSAATCLCSFSSVKCLPVIKEEEEEIEIVRSVISAKRRAAKNIVTPGLLLEQKAQAKGQKGATSTAKGAEGRVAEKWPWYRGQRLCLGSAGGEGGDLVMHRQEVPLVNAFLTEAFRDMYLTLARAEKEVALARHHSKTAKAATAKTQAVFRERNVLQLKVGRLEQELKEMSQFLEVLEEARAEAERKNVEELTAACAKAVEEYKVRRGSRTLCLMRWELLFVSPSSGDAVSPLDAEAGGDSEGGGGEEVSGPASKKMPEQRVDA
ncbi:PREDICTED: LOC110768041 isoform [Prunus dulcis]|uniref:PREDICTED: LOC110768041 isoform n=1 Tax=Prunus dulcis TaxID=3755 RepID=A0A5E4FJW2_PRUDU|nr:PREDICTED: LOC110768041 isoform [Prunus dulcis]